MIIKQADHVAIPM